MDEPKPATKAPSTWTALAVVWDIGFAIAVPTVICALGGRWLDARYGTSPLFLILGLFAALAVSGVIVVRKGNRIVKQL